MFITLDTNILLINANNLFTIAGKYPDATIVIPETVVDEIDSKKSLLGELGYQAREFGRIISSAQLGETIRNDQFTSSVRHLGSITIHIVSCSSYPQFDESLPSILMDRRIIHVASLHPGIFITNDTMCGIRASTLGIEVQDFRDVDEVTLQFTYKLSVPYEVFATAHNEPILSINPDHKQEYYCYELTCQDTAQVKLGTIQNGILKIIGRDTEKELRNQLMPPTNAGQLFLSSLIQDPTSDIIISEAIAGSGKSISALSNAMKLVSTNPIYSSIIYIRNSVDDVAEEDERIGFLSGNDEKLQVYLHPFYDSLNTIARRNVSNKLKGQELEEKVASIAAEYVVKYNMQAMIALGLRGRTFDNSIIIIDEAQNISKATMQKILSRVGRNCKVIITGSLRQIDSKYITKYTSGLSVLLAATKLTDLPIKITAVTLDKVVRGPITEFAERIFSKQ